MELDALVNKGYEGDERCEHDQRGEAHATPGQNEPAEQDTEHGVLAQVRPLSDDEGNDVWVEVTHKRKDGGEQGGNGVALAGRLRAGDERVAPYERHPTHESGAPRDGGAPRVSAVSLGRHASAAMGTAKCLPT